MIDFYQGGALMNAKNYTLVSAVVFSIVAILQGLRVVNREMVVIGMHVVPLWASAVATVIAAFLAYSGFQLYKKS